MTPERKEEKEAARRLASFQLVKELEDGTAEFAFNCVVCRRPTIARSRPGDKVAGPRYHLKILDPIGQKEERVGFEQSSLSLAV